MKFLIECITNRAGVVGRTSLYNPSVVDALKQPLAMRMCSHLRSCDWNDTIKHQRSLLCFNGTFNKTDISSSQQQCLDREGEGGPVRVPSADRLVAPDK